jgi:hypothetical protein
MLTSTLEERTVKSQIVRQDFGWKEMYKLLFKRKVCGKCGSKLKRAYADTEKGAGWDNMSNPLEIDMTYSKSRIHRTTVFRCDKCDVDIRLEDL